MKNNSAFAALGAVTAPHQKEAFWQGLKNMGSGALNAAGGAIRNTVGNATAGLQANVGGAFNAMTGRSKGFEQGKKDQWNQTQALNAESARQAQAGAQQMQGGAQAAAARAGQVGGQVADRAKQFGKDFGSVAAQDANAIGQGAKNLAMGGVGLGMAGAKAVNDAGVATGQAIGQAGQQAVQGAQTLGNQALQAGQQAAGRAQEFGKDFASVASQDARALGQGAKTVGLTGLGLGMMGAKAVGDGVNAAGEAAGYATHQGLQAAKDYGNQGIQAARNLGNQALQQGQQAVQGAQQFGTGAYNAAAGGINSAVGNATQGLQANVGGAFNAMRGTSQGFEQGRADQWNQSGALNAAQDQRAQQGMQQMRGAFGGQQQPGVLAKSGSAFHALGLTKEAGGPASWIAKGLTAGGKALRGVAKNKKIDAAVNVIGPQKTDELSRAAFKATGNGYAGTGKALTNAGKKIEDTPWLKNTINATSVAGLGAGAYGVGRGQGREAGIGEGLTTGIDIGARHAYQPDPGILGRLGQVFTGTPQADMSALESYLSQNKDKIIQAILSRK